ncbi:unnamed protein product [Paramecium pentaurelia]|uniref:Tyr recombinase domain-containing protein n=1 Tax=Paramecium pentaurelia TaxID=43138 RepID=A0A8S1XSS4_9CILI|nr:unnamed protein product [Paramecium pentaurelia]
MKFLQEQNIMDLNTISNPLLLNYLQKGKPTLQEINSLQYLRKILKLPETNSVNQKIKALRSRANAKKIKNPHQSWDLIHIQKFIDDLCSQKNEILAYRIYILYELAARISDLSQIRYDQLLEGKINYIPKKQEKSGVNAMQNFIICDSVQQQTQIFINRNNINEASTLDIGYENLPIQSKSFQKQLRKACSELLNTRNHQYHQDYQQFLLKINYHDLRHSKLSEMHKSGIDQKVIQQFVKHSNLKVTALYLKNVHLESVIDLNLGCVRQVNPTYKSMILKLFFIRQY